MLVLLLLRSNLAELGSQLQSFLLHGGQRLRPLLQLPVQLLRASLQYQDKDEDKTTGTMCA